MATTQPTKNRTPLEQSMTKQIATKMLIMDQLLLTVNNKEDDNSTALQETNHNTVKHKPDNKNKERHVFCLNNTVDCSPGGNRLLARI